MNQQPRRRAFVKTIHGRIVLTMRLDVRIVSYGLPMLCISLSSSSAATARLMMQLHR